MAFIGIRVPHETARLLGQVEIPGEKVASDEMHVTMVYLGKDVPIEVLARAMTVTFSVVNGRSPFAVQTHRVTTFPPNPVDGVPIIAPIESPDLHAFRRTLVQAFQAEGVPFNNKYPDYHPHVTLGYTKDETVHAEHTADKALPVVQWGVGEVVMWGGDSGDGKVTVTVPFVLSPAREARWRGMIRKALKDKSAEGRVAARFLQAITWNKSK